MQSFLITLLICSVAMSALGLLYMAFTPFLARIYSATGRYYAWLVIVIGLIIPFRPQFKNAIVKVDMPPNTHVPVLQTGNGAPFITPAPNSFPSSLPAISWWQLAAAVWMAGMALFLFYHLIRHNRFLKLAARWSEIVTDEQTLSLLHSLKTRMGVSKQIELQICDSIDSPMMTGFANPLILLPRADFTNDELCFILKHEIVHYKRKDLWYKLLVLIATAIHWFNPMIHFMAKAINLQCELSCDAEVVHNTGPETRQYYSETILGVVRRRSKLKTVLSTNFYGGKKGMKERISSIMDMNKKKAGIGVLCCALVLTFGTGFAFATNTADTESQGPLGTASFAYQFHPDPQVYSQYSSYGITISEDGEMLLYNGQRVKLFVDESSDTEAFFLDEGGTLDLSVMRNAAGNITGIECISENKAQDYRSAFFAGDDISNVQVQETAAVKETVQEVEGDPKFEQYGAYGITHSADGEIIYYNGQRVKLLIDERSDGNFETFWTDEDGTISLSVVRNSTGQIISIDTITEEQAQRYKFALDDYEKAVLDGLDEKIEARVLTRMKELYPEN